MSGEYTFGSDVTFSQLGAQSPIIAAKAMAILEGRQMEVVDKSHEGGAQNVPVDFSKLLAKSGFNVGH